MTMTTTLAAMAWRTATMTRQLMAWSMEICNDDTTTTAMARAWRTARTRAAEGDDAAEQETRRIGEACYVRCVDASTVCS